MYRDQYFERQIRRPEQCTSWTNAQDRLAVQGHGQPDKRLAGAILSPLTSTAFSPVLGSILRAVGNRQTRSSHSKEARASRRRERQHATGLRHSRRGESAIQCEKPTTIACMRNFRQLPKVACNVCSPLVAAGSSRYSSYPAGGSTWIAS